ncbi:tyrosine-protein kinase JAK2 isoform X2 [Sardina pilchardus]|uniref:tyrosine-protein kinase JAK2 isoform X2 n=1 Tax=Sardina pilchardus TaxID=27697 RepID=UPI002E0F3164
MHANTHRHRIYRDKQKHEHMTASASAMDLSEEETTPLVYRDRGGSHRSSCRSGLQVNLHFFPVTKAESTFCIPGGQISAENVCIQAAKTCGILPVFHSLFGLASEDLSFWYPPTHVFNAEESTVVNYRVRYFFSNWFGQGTKTSYRYSLARGKVSAVLDYCVIDYLFAQSRSDFVNGQAGVRPSLGVQEECLGLAVLDLWCHAKEQVLSLKDICKRVGYKSCLPEAHRQKIQGLSRLARYQIRKTVKRFLKRLGHCQASECNLKLKYLMELAAIEPMLGTETFQGQDAGYRQGQQATTRLIRVSGETGVQTRTDEAAEWHTFCDFPKITDISIKQVCHEQVPQEGRVVTLTRQDDRFVEVEFPSLTEALSFVSLVDGYFRLTTDSSHYFCQEVAPPSLLEDLQNYCHGPITPEFAVHKLKKAGAKHGTFLLRHSTREFNKYFLTVCVQTSLGKDYKDCLVVSNEQVTLAGVHNSFVNLKSLVEFYQKNKFYLGDDAIKLETVCPPRPKELTNLIIVRQSTSVELQGSPPLECHKPSHIQFQMIRYEELELGESLGQGSFTRIHMGRKIGTRDGEKYVTDILLKILNADAKTYWESFFEAASMMSQVSHKHLLHVYGISVNQNNNIMVQEFVKSGALDLYLRRTPSVSVSWKLEVAKQLACALNFLEEKNLVHGNICARNVLLARGEPSPFIKLSDPGISVTAFGTDEKLGRIPWVAPELLAGLDSLELESDKWSFGTTLWEVFNGGKVPLQGFDPHQKLHFYENNHRLPSPEWTELADLISHCMNYQPALRPSSRSIIRHLNSLITSDYEILHAAGTTNNSDTFWRDLSLQSYHPEQTVYEERHLRYISPLGKGNFGSVELCRYDPLGDNTGELIAIKRLQSNKQGNLADFRREIETISSLHCDFIVKYRGVCYSMGRCSVSLVMEYLPHGSLIGYLENRPSNVNHRRLLLFASQICKGMEYLQSMRLIHRDLAARNVLVASDILVKIADFGLTKIIPYDKEYYKVSQPGQSPIFWYAPESISESKFSHKSDVWSFGVVLHELFSYCELSLNPKKLCMQGIGSDIQGHCTSMHLFNILKDKWRLPAPPFCPPKVYSIMMKCWAWESEERPSFSSLAELVEDTLQEDRDGFKG